MEDRMLTSKTQKHYEHIFLHYYFSSISDYCAESMVRSLISKVDSIDGKYKIAVAQMCVWVRSKITYQNITYDGRNFKIFIFKPKLSLLGKITRNYN